MKKLHNYQFDFIKIKTEKVNKEFVNWNMLNEHPTIKNAYTLDAKSGLYGKNFKLYFTKDNNVVLETSIPYLLNAHNYVQVGISTLTKTLKNLDNLLNIPLMSAQVLEFEYGAYKSTNLPATNYISSIISLGHYDLKFSSPYMKMYGKSNLNFKIYNAAANAKKKKTFTRGKYPSSDKLIKYEIKFINPLKHFKNILDVQQLCSFRFEFKMKQILDQHINSIVVNNNVMVIPKGNTVNHFMYAALKNYEQLTSIRATNLVSQLISDSSLDAPQKSKRRKSITQLETLYQNN